MKFHRHGDKLRAPFDSGETICLRNYFSPLLEMLQAEQDRAGIRLLLPGDAPGHLLSQC
ncbi:hypothetical protein [Rhizobium sp. BR 315]|uniref:hypothetical protein n=1 Tax=Rhizobium sp. BR 315 TaxID=3040014 RepID=UPI003D3537D9